MIDLQNIANDWAAGQALAIRLSQAPAKPTCECDYDGQGDPLEYVKTSHYCPVHDICEGCMDRMGCAKDPGWKVQGGCLAWVCAECLALCNDHGEKDCKLCANREQENAIEAARCQHCGKDDCRQHTNAELLARGGGDL